MELKSYNMACSSDCSNSLARSSDEIKEMFCEPCKIHDSVDEPATGFCANCEEYMCDTCLRYDRRQNVRHKHLDKDNMPQDFCLEKCSVHKDCLIKYICLTCNKLICKVCKESNHQSCGNVQHLPTYLKDFENSTEFTQLMGNISNLSKKIEETDKKVRRNFLQTDHQQGDATSVVNAYSNKIQKDLTSWEQELTVEYEREKERLIQETKLKIKRLTEKQSEKIAQINEQKEVLVKARNKIIKQVTARKDTEEERLRACLHKNKAMATDIDLLHEDLEQKRRPGWRYKLFLALKPAQDHVQELESDLQIMEEETEVSEYTIEPTQTNVRTKTLGPVENVFFLKEIWKQSRRRNGTFEHEIHAETTTKFGCTSLCLFSEFKLIVTDNESKCLYSSVMESENCQKMTISPLLERMQTGPWQAVKVRTNTLVVAVPSEGKVKAVKVTESTNDTAAGYTANTITGKVTEAVVVGEGCTGLAYFKDNLIVSYKHSAKVQILDMSGNIKREIENDSEGNQLFITPRYLAVSHDNKTIYVSDSDKHAVTSMTFKGKVEAVYKDSKLRKPGQLAVDRSGAVFVCGEDSDNIHQLSAGLEKVKILLDKSHGIEKPVGLAYCNRQDRLYVGMRKPLTVKVFKISPE